MNDVLAWTSAQVACTMHTDFFCYVVLKPTTASSNLLSFVLAGLTLAWVCNAYIAHTLGCSASTPKTYIHLSKHVNPLHVLSEDIDSNGRYQKVCVVVVFFK